MTTLVHLQVSETKKLVDLDEVLVVDLEVVYKERYLLRNACPFFIRSEPSGAPSVWQRTIKPKRHFTCHRTSTL